MCIFSQPVDSVDNTKIFARKTKANSQFLVYQMNYSSSDSNAMILPIPKGRLATEENGFQFIDLSQYEDFFDDLALGFPRVRRAGFGCSAGPVDSKSSLEVHEIGDFIASFVPELSQFERLDKRFTLPKSTWAKVSIYKDYGFVVFQLVEGTKKPHPMAFKFASKMEEIYFPTLHIHDGEVHEEESFDHTLFLQHAGMDSKVGRYRGDCDADTKTNLVRSKWNAGEFCEIDETQGIVQADLLIHKKILRGTLDNRDFLVEVDGDPLVRAYNVRQMNACAPWAVAAGAAAWFFARRNRVMEQTKA